MKARQTWLIALVLFAFGMGFMGCSDDEDDDQMMSPQGLNPDTAPRVSIDRFSASAGHLFVRDGSNGLPAANSPINMDQAPFVTHGFKPGGGVVSYYNFDVMPLAPAPIYVLKRASDADPVAGQLNIVDVVPGDAGYNDFWQPMLVTVPDDYVANTIHSLSQITDMGLMMTPLDAIVNCPIVPEGSTASLGGGANGLTRGWYRDQVVFISILMRKRSRRTETMFPSRRFWCASTSIRMKPAAALLQVSRPKQARTKLTMS